MGKKTKAKRKAENNNAPFSIQPESKNINLEEPINLPESSIDRMPQLTSNQETPTKMFDWIQGAADVLSGSALASSEDLDAVFDYHFGKLRGLEEANNVEYPKIACAECNREFILHQELHLDCTQCGKIFCSQHSNNGALDVCMTCWKSRKPEEICDGGHIKSWNESFYSQRQNFRQHQLQERTLLKKRLSKLILIRREASGGDSEKILQKRLVNWKNDASTDACAFCKEVFTVLNRKSHCRFCGEIICKNCTLTVSDFKACKNCYRQLKQSTESFINPKDHLTELFDNLIATRKQILQGLPRYNEYLCNLEDELYSTSRNGVRIDTIKHDAMAIRNTLQIMFDNYTLLLQSISKEKTINDSQRNLVIENISYACGIFLKLHKFSLRYLPETFDIDQAGPVAIPKGQTPSNSSSKSASLIPSFIANFLSSVSNKNPQLKTVQEVQMPLPANLGALMQRLEILHEQKSQLETTLEEAHRERRYGDMTTLHIAIEEIVQEIDHVKLMCISNK